tara:strand:- start:510 stop:929 length:420 start_codon:yes stop_codon:yes gene_type:complete
MLVLNDKRCREHIEYMVGQMGLIKKLATIHKSGKVNDTIEAVQDLSWLDPLSIWHPNTQKWVNRIIGAKVGLVDIQYEGEGAKRAAALVDLILKLPAGLVTVENPEDYLHPAAQAEMAEFLARRIVGEPQTFPKEDEQQ